jgi:hypothetical protein
MYYDDNFVLISPQHKESFVNGAELRDILGQLLANLPATDQPTDLQTLPTIAAKVERLMATACDLECADGRWQWYTVRLHK